MLGYIIELGATQGTYYSARMATDDMALGEHEVFVATLEGLQQVDRPPVITPQVVLNGYLKWYSSELTPAQFDALGPLDVRVRRALGDWCNSVTDVNKAYVLAVFSRLEAELPNDTKIKEAFARLKANVAAVQEVA